MNWKPADAFTTSMKGKQVRFKTSFTAPNLTSQFGINQVHGATIQLPPGAVGRIYEVRGATMFIGFGRDFNTAPPEHTSPTYFKATIQFYLDSAHKVEVES